MLLCIGIVVTIALIYAVRLILQSPQRKKQNMLDRKRRAAEAAKDDSQSLVFIRHGQAKHNVDWRALDEKDPPLTEAGIKQVEDLRAMILNEFPRYFDDVELVIVSPLRRALKTMMILFGNRGNGIYGKAIMVEPIAAERGNKLCDIGIKKGDLLEEFPEVKLLKTMRELKKKWWKYPEEMTEFKNRMLRLKLWIQSRPEENILLITHDGVIQALTSEKLMNAELTVATWERPTRTHKRRGK